MSVRTASHLEEILDYSKANPEQLLVLNFWTSWADSCIQMNEVVEALAATHQAASFWDVDAETVSSAALHFRIESVPTFVLVRDGHETFRVNGAKPEELVTAVEKGLVQEGPEDLKTRLQALINRHRFMIFIKGTPQAPRCGFTRQLLALLDTHAIKYDYFDILQDEAIRQGLKEFSDWPTYPQIYFEGELVGGLDILKEMAETGQLAQLAAPL